MVLQRGKPIKIWGWSAAGEKVTVQFGGQTEEVEAGTDGRWMVTLKPMKASDKGRTLKISPSNKARKPKIISDVLVGEVWVCSGQSNMQYSMSRFRNCAYDVPNMKYPLIRHFSVVRADSAVPARDVWGAWAVCSPETADRFSATALYFAVELRKAIGIPIGLINSSVGGTSAYQWSAPATLAADPDIAPRIEAQKEQAAKAAAAAKANPELLAAYEKAMRQYLFRVGVNAGAVIPGQEQDFITPDLSDPTWAPTKVPKRVPNGLSWFAREVVLPNEMIGKELTINLGRVYREESTYWNGVKIGSKRFYGDPSIHTIPTSLTRGGRNLLSVRAAGIRGGEMSGRQSIAGPDGQSLSLSADGWKYHVYASEPVFPKELSVGRGASYGGLYNGMIAPLIPYAIRGVIWYQGENGPDGYTYRKVFRELIQGWRRNWGQGDFPFYFCQLANYHPKQHAVSTNHGWSLIREAQAMALELPNTGMACLIDVGKLGTYPRDIHPANNLDQGRRLALIARDKIYGEDIVSSGPMFDSMTVQGSKILVRFKTVGSGLMRAGIKGWYDHTITPLPTHPKGLAIHGFTIAGADGDFRMAHARIVGKDSVEVWHPKVPEPKHVRFAWHRNPLHNLYNMAKLPAPPFRTDQFDLSEAAKRKRRK
ncbi:sialate O-acetylesterase [Planctomycetota bacterium]